MRLSKKLYKLKYYLRKTWKEELRKAETIKNYSQRELDEILQVRLQNRKEHAKSVESAEKLHHAEMTSMRKEQNEQVENAYEKHDDIYKDQNLESWSSPQQFQRVSAQMEINRKLHAEMLQVLLGEKKKAEEELRQNAEVIKELEMSRESQQNDLVENDMAIETLIQDKYEYLLQQIDESESVDEELELKKRLERLNFSD
ncbi:PREDICTED: uncharacterized protein LOC108561816 [Nicrophorus vespilloides]|uniref:Uncharacterized protein LOC108561816 n=1 Tax=Nicrophorus vespilloides TaxID=110193 RepID=A0ABM1MLC6_NICVS|nr:PREDICTED: uncharacterized protein LOC108561816 [Nicrophorus vespilloides]